MHTVIIGNGISGITAARFLRKHGENKITVISAESDFFFSRTALMYIYMGHMTFENTKPYEDWFWKKNRIDLINGWVNQINFEKKVISIQHKQNASTENGKLAYDQLIIATGSESNKFGWPGQDLEGVRGLYAVQDLEYLSNYNKKIEQAVIVGGGLIGIELAEMLHSRHIPVTMLVREQNYWNNVLPKEESLMIGAHILKNGIDLRLGAELKEIVDDGHGACAKVLTKDLEEIPCQYVGLTAGVHPNIAWLKNTELATNRGVLVDAYLKTNQADVYAIGDCAEIIKPQNGRRPIEAIWYTGRMMGETVAANIMGKNIEYDPGLWFNSAKFFDIEYQVYGDVPANNPDTMASFFWQSVDGEKSVRINYDKSNQEVKGFNLLGIRFRHEVCEKWILSRINLNEVMSKLNLAVFDPELYRSSTDQIINQFNQQTGSNIKSSAKIGWKSALSFLKK